MGYRCLAQRFGVVLEGSPVWAANQPGVLPCLERNMTTACAFESGLLG